jgi:cytochrome c heme-lyase
VYNVYNQRIDQPEAAASARYELPGALDPRNQMPAEPNQQPCPGQRKLLPTDRIPSAIPKGGTDGTWLYPSPQMFYNGESLPLM